MTEFRFKCGHTDTAEFSASVSVGFIENCQKYAREQDCSECASAAAQRASTHVHPLDRLAAWKRAAAGVK